MEEVKTEPNSEDKFLLYPLLSVAMLATKNDVNIAVISYIQKENNFQILMEFGASEHDGNMVKALVNNYIAAVAAEQSKTPGSKNPNLN